MRYEPPRIETLASFVHGVADAFGSRTAVTGDDGELLEVAVAIEGDHDR
jgi:hypothetical protein